MSQRNSNESPKNKSINIWKWAFIAIVIVIILFIIYFIIALQPVSQNNPNQMEQPTTNSANDESIALSTSMQAEDAEQLINTFLQTTLGEEFQDFHAVLSNQLEFHGSITFIGLDIPFSLYLRPSVLPNGNIQFHGETVKLASLDLPVSTVMALLSNQVDFPNFIGIDSEEQTLTIALDQLTADFQFAIEMTQFNLEAPDNQLALDLYIEEDLIIEYLKEYESQSE